MTGKKILVVEDERIVAEDIKISLKKLGYEVCGIAVSGMEAIRKAEEFRPDLVMMDIILEGEMDGIEAAEIIRSRFDIPVIYLTAYADDKTLERAKMTEPFGYILKPFEDREVHSTFIIEMALYKHKMGRKLKESEKKYRILFEESRDAIYITSRGGKIVDFNPSMLDLFGYAREKMLGMDIFKIYVNPKDRTRFRRRIEKAGFVKNYELKLQDKDGRVMDCLLTASVKRDEDGSIFGYQGSIHDITHRKRAEQELVLAKEKAETALKKLREIQTHLVQRERLAALGELSAGVAHEINNPLNIISGHTQMLLMEESIDSEIEDTLKIIKKQVDRTSKITDQLLHFSKRTQPENREIDINETVNNALALLEHQLTLDNIKVERKLLSKPAFVRADPSQFQQVFHNLIINASHAMPDGGTLTISTTVKNPNAEISFTDTGCGIPEKYLKKLFEPFFTTKEKGTGLGLSIVYGIIEAHKGDIKVKSKVGEGTTFTITLPILKKNLKQGGKKWLEF